VRQSEVVSWRDRRREVENPDTPVDEATSCRGIRKIDSRQDGDTTTYLSLVMGMVSAHQNCRTRLITKNRGYKFVSGELHHPSDGDRP